MAQTTTVRAHIQNSVTGESLPYAHILFENYNLGTTADENGNFGFQVPDSLLQATLRISYVGFSTKTIRVGQLKNKLVELYPLVEEFNDVFISEIIEDQKFVFQPEWNRDRNMGIGNLNSGLYPSILARFYPKPEKFTKACFLEELQIYFYKRKEIRELQPIFRLHIYEVDKNGLPGNDLLRNYLVKFEGRQSKTKLNLLKEKIRIPESGFFVGLEHLFIPENKYEEKTDFYINDSLVAKDYIYERYAPVYKGVFVENNADIHAYYYGPGGWMSMKDWEVAYEFSGGGYGVPVFKIKLTD